LCGSFAQAASVETKAAKTFRKIGVGPEQTEAYAELYEKFLKSRNSQVRRVLKNAQGEQVSVMAKKKARRAANQSVKKMGAVLTELQLKYYAQYLEITNQIFLREAGLR
jgi:hypothetical protein